MQANEVKREIQELESLRSQMRWWRLGTLLVLVVIVVACIATINGAVQGLTKPGPVQDQFVADVSTRLQTTVVPKVQTIAAQTVAQLQPKVEDELAKLNDRVPELAEVSMKELELLEKNLPARGEKVLNATFGEMLKKREPKIREMFPEVTEDKVQTLVANLTEEGQNRIVLAHDRMFSPHLASMNNIFEHMLKIQGSEKISPNADQTNWEMAVLVVDIFHDDLKSLQAQSQAKPAADSKGKVTVNSKPAGAKPTAAKAASVKPISGQKSTNKPAAAKKETSDGY